MPRRRFLPKTRVKPTGVMILLWGLVVLIAMNLLARFNVVDFTTFQSDILMVLAIFFVATEIGIMGMFRKKMDWVSWIGAIVVALALIALVLGWFGMSIGFLTVIKGAVDVALLIFVVIEIFR